MTAERALDVFALAFPQQSGIDEDTGELVADRAVYERGGHGRVDAARQTANDLCIADLLADPRDGLVDERSGSPGRLTAAYAEREIRQHLAATRRVCHLRVEHDAEDRSLRVAERGDRQIMCGGEHLEARRRLLHVITMTRPYQHGLVGSKAVEQVVRSRDADLGPTVLAPARKDAATVHLREQLHAVADAEHRHTELEQFGIGGRHAGVVD